MNPNKTEISLRIALLAGTLSQGGAEKQFVYVARALKEMGVAVRLFSLTRGEHYEASLEALGLHPIWVGRFANPLIRLLVVTRLAATFRPHIFQAWHFYTNLYVSLLPRFQSGVLGVGAIRNDAFHEVETNGYWSRWLLRAPDVLIANSYTGKENAAYYGIGAGKVYTLPNVIDLNEFDLQTNRWGDREPDSNPHVAVTVARLTPVKRLERFLRALALARQQVPNLVGWIIGDGPERLRLEAEAERLGLFPKGVRFWGARTDVPSLLHRAHIFVLTSEREGFPNVLLEAMAASLPVVTTPAGDAGIVVQDGVTGYVVSSSNSIEEIAERLVRLASDADLRSALGSAGRSRVEQQYSYHSLPQTLDKLYSTIIANHGR
jgi:glycosyltransferase involved in cell wall biosynthesis